jgi:ribosomal-protein-alanine N-acetyltransferase
VIVLIIRDFKISDIDDVVRIEYDSFPDPYPMGLLLELHKKGAGFLVAQIGSGVIGYIVFWIREGMGHIIAIAVDERFHNMKVGSMLLLNAIRILQEHNIYTVRLEVRKSNINARKFYQKRGFKQVKYCRKYYSDGEDAIIMQYDGLDN